VKQIFRYPGGKSRPAVQRVIHQYWPSDYTEYREPFVGGGSLAFGVPPSKRRWINDFNRHLIAVYVALRDRSDDFIAACRAIEPANENEERIISARGTQYNRRLKDTFNRFLADDDMDPALRYYFLNRVSFNGRVILDPARRNRAFFSNPDGWNLVNTTALEQAAELLQGVYITCNDFEELLLAPGDNVLVVCDPPYVRETELVRSAKLYEFGFSYDDHHRFAAAALASPHRVLITYDDHPMIRQLYRNFFIHEASWHYSGTVNNRRRGRELIITNYPVLQIAEAMAPVEFIDSQVISSACLPEDCVPLLPKEVVMPKGKTKDGADQPAGWAPVAM
jgi:DNA adenine methylase